MVSDDYEYDDAQAEEDISIHAETIEEAGIEIIKESRLKY